MKPCFLSEIGKSKVYKTNEQYIAFLKRQNRMNGIFIVIGILIALIAFAAEFLAEQLGLVISIDDYMLGVYAGVGCGLLVAGIIRIIRNCSIMKDEEKLTLQRRERGDERLQEISRSAMRISALLMIIGMYAISLIGGLFYPVLPKILLILICIYLVTYVVCYRILEKRM